VSQSVRAGRGHQADQGAVWAHLADRASRLRVDSATGAMRDVYASHQTDLTAARQALAAQPGQVGALVYMAGRWVGFDLLAGAGLFGRAWPRLCAGYVADAIGREAKRWVRLHAGAVLATVAQGEAERAPAVGLGNEYRLGTSQLAGATLIAQGWVAHLMMFPASGASEVNE
jgi:ARG and Rhodanese-Phosphatase-superfamily-associated Protein domain